MKTVTYIMSVVAVLASDPALAVDDGKYACIIREAVGIQYDEQNRRSSGDINFANKQFILTVKKVTGLKSYCENNYDLGSNNWSRSERFLKCNGYYSAEFDSNSEIIGEYMSDSPNIFHDTHYNSTFWIVQNLDFMASLFYPASSKKEINTYIVKGNCSQF